MRSFIVVFFLLLVLQLNAQNVLRGKVTAADTHKPLPLVNVFLSNTSVGTVTNENGEFVIERIPNGRFDLVISCVGYETYVTTLQSAQVPAFLSIVLLVKINELQEVIVEPYEKNGWDKWGKFFLDNFVGTSDYASDCKLKNPEVIRFRYNKKQNILRAFADEPIILINRALGYQLTYTLKTFEYNYATRIFYYQGYPLFEDLPSDKNRQIARWERNRADAYEGSLMHFMRSLFRNKLIEDGFEVRKLIKVSEAEQKRVKAIYQSRVYLDTNRVLIASDSVLGKGNKDSAEYYRKVMRQPEKMNVLINQVLPGDSIAYALDNFTAGLFFSDYLQVIYKFKRVPAAYASAYGLSVDPRSPISSELYLPRKNPVSVLANGSFYEGLDLITSGYWGWWEKLATMLPFDYQPPPNNK